jgi:carboxymethylenebutenolidase
VAQFSTEKPRCPTICHFGDSDHAIPLEKIKEIRESRQEVTVYVYEGAGHGFNCDQRDSWNAEAAALARQRTLDHLRRFVG